MTPEVTEIVRELEQIGDWHDGGKVWEQNVWCAAAAQALTRLSERNAARQKANRDCYEIEGCPHWVDACTRYQRAEAKLAEIEDRRDHTEGGLQLLLAAAKAGDPMQEIIFRIEEELRQLRAPVSGSTEGGNG